MLDNCASIDYIDCNAIRADAMASVTIRNLEERTKQRLRVRAARHGRSMEEEAREILRQAVDAERAMPANLAEAVRARFAPLGGVELELPERDSIREPVRFEE